MKKKVLLLLIIAIVMILGAGCQKDEQLPKDTISQEDYEKLPDDQQDSELDKALAEVRKEAKAGMKEKDGKMLYMVPSGSTIPGYVQDPNDFSVEVSEDIFETIFAYLEKKGIDTKANGTIGSCYDPRMNKIYEDEDKGVAKGYENKDIFVAEYETKKTGVYSYLIVVRDKNGNWSVLYDGTNYKDPN